MKSLFFGSNAIYIGEVDETNEFIYNTMRVLITNVDETGNNYTFKIVPICYPIDLKLKIININKLDCFYQLDDIPTDIASHYQSILTAYNQKEEIPNKNEIILQ